MFYKPSIGGMWDPSLIVLKDTYYMLSMHYEELSKWDGMWLAKSSDGVHWEDVGRVLTGDLPICKMFVYLVGDEIIVNHGSISGRPGTGNDTLRFYRSKDMMHWEHLYDTHPDSEYYNPAERWDHMYVIKDNGMYLGYVVAVPKKEYHSAIGMMKSDDGIHFKAIAPPTIEWGDVPEIKVLEGGGCEKIGEKYYYIGGAPGYCNECGYGLFTFVADSPFGPFRPDADAFRLCGFSDLPGRVFIQNLAAFFRDKNGDVLVSNAVEGGGPDRIFLLPVRRAAVDENGHLHLAYWEKNELAKGRRIELSADCIKTIFASEPPDQGNKSEFTIGEHLIIKLQTATPSEFQTSDFYRLLKIDQELDFHKGVIFEGEFSAEKCRGSTEDDVWPNCWRKCNIGFTIMENDNIASAVVLDVGDRYKRKSYIQKINYRNQDMECITIDVTGEGCATLRGVSEKQSHSFKLFVRQNMYELYVDNMLVQTFVTLHGPAKALGILAENCRCEFQNLAIYEMNFL